MERRDRTWGSFEGGLQPEEIMRIKNAVELERVYDHAIIFIEFQLGDEL